MNLAALPTQKTLKSRIPIPVNKAKSSNLKKSENKICEKQLVSQTVSNSNTTATKTSNLHQGVLAKRYAAIRKVSAVKMCKGNEFPKKTSTASEITNKKVLHDSFHLLKKEITKSNTLTDKALTDRNIKSSKSISSNFNSYSGAKININSKQIKSKKFIKPNVKSNKENLQTNASSHIKRVPTANNKCTENSVHVHKSKPSNTDTKTAVEINPTSEKMGKEKMSSSKTLLEPENREKAKIFPAQENINFEANEVYRNMILRNRELSPSLCQQMPGLKLSSILPRRPSAYQEFIVHPDPFADVMQALASASAKRSARKLTIPKEKKTVPLSPFKVRSSFYTPGADPEIEVMRSLGALKAKKMQKSSKKKVTFNFNVEEFSAKINSDLEPLNYESSESRLTQISEENTPSSPVKSETDDGAATCVKIESSKKSPEFQKSSIQVKAANQIKSLEEHHHSPQNKISETHTPPTKLTLELRDFAASNILPSECMKPSFCSSKKSVLTSSTPDFVYSNINSICESLYNQRVISHTLLERNMIDKNVNRTSQAKLYTPRPISFFSKSRLIDDDPSPEFLAGKLSEDIANLAPIYTPLVLKNIAKNSALSPEINLSPVRLKLDFTVIGKDTPKKEVVTCHPSTSLEKILTAQKKLDELADQECSFWLLNESTVPVICGRYLQNPIAVTLTHGDEMHFVPVGP